MCRKCSRLAQVSARGRSYRYIGLVELKTAVRPGSGGCRISSAAEFGGWIAGRSAAELAEPFTFVVDTDGVLRLAPRRSEHVACAGGGMVLSAGEIGFVREADWWAVGEVSNQSTGYCPDVTLRFPRDAGRGDSRSDRAHEKSSDDACPEEVPAGVA